MNGYEIRLELLKMAKDLGESEFATKREITNAIFYNYLDRYKDVPNHKFEIPQYEFPTSEDIISLADRLNTFIDKKS